MIKLIYLFAFALIVGGLLYQFAALETFNLFVPKDEASKLLQADVAYGPDPRNRLDVYAPKAITGPLPVIVYVHGGSWRSGNKSPYEFLGRALAAKGFLVMAISYRLHPDHPFPAFVDDAALALDWATRHASEFGGDQKRIFAMGHSAGGFNVTLAVLDKRYFASLGTDASSIKGVAVLAAPLDFLPLDGPITRDVFGKVPDLSQTQPVNFARPDAPPFLILHGSADATCLPRNSIALDKALRAVGASSILKIYGGVGHVGIMLAIAKPLRNKTPTLEDVTAFFRAHS